MAGRITECAGLHASSFENMVRCHDRYLGVGARDDPGCKMVVDIGGADVNGGYRRIFSDPRYRYVIVDVQEGEGVDVVLEDPYRLPFADASVDVVLSGQMLEHCEFFWQSFAEMVRILKPDGLLFLIAPSAGPVHRYPVDCYRFYPDAYRALAKFAGCHLVNSWLDERGPWRDLVGVFSKNPDTKQIPPAPQRPVSQEIRPGLPEEEITLGQLPYLELLREIHTTLAPGFYLEIGVRRGKSLQLAQDRALGIDPAPEIAGALPSNASLVRSTSDDYFHDHALAGDGSRFQPDLAFIDGMHLFEYALRDFMHIERLAGPSGLVVVDDVLPCHPAQAERQRRTRVWTGDVWKLGKCLERYRPDLFLTYVDTAPTGLLLVAGLDPKNRVLWDKYNPIVREYSQDRSPPADLVLRQGAIAPSDKRIAGILRVLRKAREERSSRQSVVAQLRTIAAGAA